MVQTGAMDGLSHRSARVASHPSHSSADRPAGEDGPIQCMQGVGGIVGVVHLHSSAQLSIFNMEKRYRNKIIIVIIIIIFIIIIIIVVVVVVVVVVVLSEMADHKLLRIAGHPDRKTR